ncbi:MAG: UDP-3-O-(3-hydroxymyristoyl)glucosamine N-acyltransferase [Bacteroidota bacterium]
MEFTLEQIASILKGRIIGDQTLKINTISSIEDGKEGSISFLSNPKYEQYLYETKASAVIVNEDFVPKHEVKATLIKVENAYTSFTMLLEEYQRILSFQKTGIEPQSFLPESVKYGENLYLAGFAYVGENVTIGNHVKIYPHAFIGDNVTIGDNTIVHPGAKVYANCKIGSYCTLHAGCVIGSDGFGFAPQEDGTYKTIPQIGNVVIEDHVDVGANTTIDCATFDSTVISKGVKIDNLVQVAHNVEIGENTVIASQTGISGSTKVGKQVIMAGQVGVVGHIKVGDGAIITAQSGISKSVPRGVTYFGSPAFEKSQYMKSTVLFRKLPDMMKRIQELEEKLLNLPSKN